MNEIQTNLKENLKSEDVEKRLQAAEEYMYTEQDNEVIELLAKLLEDSDKGVRNAAALALKFSTNQSEVANQISHLIASTDINIRNMSGDILVNCGSDAIKPLSELLPQTDHDGAKFIVDLFSLIKDKSATNVILQTLRTTTDENVILACAEAVGVMECEDAIEDLITTYWMNEFYRPTVVDALGKIGTQEALDFLTKNYNEADELTQFSIIESLGVIGDSKSFFFLISQLNNHEQAIKWPIIDSIFKLKEKFGFDVPFEESMKNAIEDTILNADTKYRYSAVNLISDFSDKKLLNACLQIYGKDPALDYELAQKLIDDTSNVYPLLINAISDEKFSKKGLLALLLEFVMNDPNANINKLDPFELRTLCDNITNFLNHPDEEIRKSSMELLFLIQPETAILFVDTMIEDSNIWNKMRLIELLQDYQDEEAKLALQKLAEDEEEMVSFQAKDAIENNLNLENN